MAQATLVENQIDDGQKLLDALAQASFDVAAACWIKSSDDGHWYLYIISPSVQAKGIREAYRELHSILRGLVGSWIDPFEVKLIGPAHPIANDVMGLLQRNPGNLPLRFGGPRLGPLSVDDAYIYPSKP
jgi:hypothetical protein